MHTDDMCNFLLQILFKSNENSCKILMLVQMRF